MGHRTLSLGLVFRALFLDSAAYDELRDDDNPFVEGLFLVVIIGIVTALLNLIGQFLAWAGTPSMSAIKDAVWQAFPQMQWWAQMPCGNSSSTTTWAGRSSRGSSERLTRPALR
jgi:hypothetical protein